ncbi:hypothetical protein J2T03_002868 [Chryseobacterium lathyri]|nr:hypothetical protein [Chryseobacterium lathyri]
MKYQKYFESVENLLKPVLTLGCSLKMSKKRVQVFRLPKTFDRLSKGGGTTKNLSYGGAFLFRWVAI